MRTGPGVHLENAFSSPARKLPLGLTRLFGPGRPKCHLLVGFASSRSASRSKGDDVRSLCEH
jgi:hypothetical protein